MEDTAASLTDFGESGDISTMGYRLSDGQMYGRHRIDDGLRATNGMWPNKVRGGYRRGYKRDSKKSK